MEFQGLKSILALPITKEENPIGFVGFETVKNEVDWTQDEIYLLSKFSKLISLSSG